MLKVFDLTTENLTDPVGVDATSPRFSWKLAGDKNDLMQASYRITVTSGGSTIWDSGSVYSDQSRGVRYAGPALTSGQQLQWRVAVAAGGETAESDAASFEMALLSRDDWKAEWIEPERDPDPGVFKPAPLLRRVFSVKPGLAKARIYQTAHGLYDFWINGAEGTEDRFMPGLTSYQMRIQYQIYDILPLLREGENAWCVQLADGWWRGTTGGGNKNNFGYKLGYLGQIVLDYADGSRDVIGTDTAFRTSTGGARIADMKAGTFYDARLEPQGWLEPDFDDSSWEIVIPGTEYTSLDVLIPSRSVPVRELERFDARPFTDAHGDLVLDFGQNIAGYVSMTLRGCKPGQVIRLLHGEGLKDGAFSTDNIENSTDDPFQVVEYTCKGDAIETFCPRFSVFGFRYAKLEGYDGDILPGDFTALAVYSEMRETGSFSCSDGLINKLVQNSLWSQKGNFLDVPTDCPTRERSSWSGDSQVYCKTAADFMDVYSFFEKWLEDLNLEQFESGCVGNTFPATLTMHNQAEIDRMNRLGLFTFVPPTMAGPEGPGGFMDGAAGWGDTATITPWTLYLCYGDRAILEQQYESAKKYSLYQREYARHHNPLYESQPEYSTYTDGVLDADYIFDTHFHWGEWLEPDGAENGGPSSFNPIDWEKRGNPIVATAYLYYSSILVAKMARVLGRTADADEFEAYAANVKRVYNKYFIKPDGTILENRQAAYARVLAFGLADEENEPKVIRKLAEAVEHTDYHLNTGFLSTPFILQQLCRCGYKEHAFRLLEQKDYPSWLHPVALGSTTILENWGGLDTYSGSFNHYSYGAVCDFLFSCVAGIQPVESRPGYKEIVIQPTIGGTLTSAEGSMDTPYGVVRSAWELTGSGAHYSVEIPVNTTATLILPANSVSEAALTGYRTCRDGGTVRISLGSGKYKF